MGAYMIHSTAKVAVNSAGQIPLTREEVWKGLVLKARDARPFFPQGICTKCDLVFEGKGYIIREATIAGNDITEIVTFETNTKVSFHQVKGPNEGVVINEIIQDDGGTLSLKFYCYLGLRNGNPGSDEEKKEQAMLDSEEKGYRGALVSTLAKTRLMVAERKL